jgi:hypothetical protein
MMAQLLWNGSQKQQRWSARRLPFFAKGWRPENVFEVLGDYAVNA